MKRNEHPLLEGIPHWIVRGGITSVLVAAMVAAAFGVLWLFKYAAPISIPFLLAFVLGIIVFPLVKVGDRLGIPRRVSAFVAVLLVFLVIWAAAQITVTGLIGEAPNIGNQLVESVQVIGEQLDDVLTRFGVTQDQVNEAVASATQAISNTFEPAATGASTDGLMQSIASGLGSLRNVVSGMISGIIGILIAAMILYYLLSDYEMIEKWIAAHLGVERELGIGIVADTTSSMRDYFKGITIKSLVTAAGSGLVLLVFGIPLVIPVMIVTFITGYVPFVGAWISVLFAVLVTFGTKGLVTALIVMVACVIIQNALEQIVFNRVVGDQLNMHPIVVLVVTILGFTVGGLLGGTLAAPLAAMVMRISSRLKTVREAQDMGLLTEEIKLIKTSGTPADDLMAHEPLLSGLAE
jgi:predicted PurR-regulated permease PerM